MSRFISKATDKCHAFFQVMRMGRKIEWTPEYKEAFSKLKQYLQQTLLLSTPREGDVLCIQSRYKLNSGERRRRGPVPNILHQQSSARCRDQVPAVGEMGTRPCSGCSKVETVFPSILSCGSSRPTIVVDHTQTECFRSASEVGNRAKRVRYKLQTPSSN